MVGPRRESLKKTKWGLFFLIIILTGVIFFLLVVTLKQRLHAPDKYNPYPTIEGSLDHYTGSYLVQQDYFISDFYNILELDSLEQDSNQESSSDEWEKNLSSMEQRLKHMKTIEVARQFLEYKEEVDTFFSDFLFRLKEVRETGSYGIGDLLFMSWELQVFVDERTEELPALFDALFVEYTIEEDENGEEIISYTYTDSMPLMIAP